MVIEKYLESFPYSNSFITDDEKWIFFLEEEAKGKFLKRSSLENDSPFLKSEKICDEDFAKRSFIHHRYLTQQNKLIFFSDENNKENFNLYELNLESRELSQMTHATYVGVSGWDDDETLLVYGDRIKTENGLFTTKVYLLDTQTREHKLLFDDSDWDYRLGWGAITFNHKKDKIYFRVDYQNARTHSNIMEWDLKTKSAKKILPKEYESPHPYIAEQKVAGNELLFINDIQGTANYSKVDLKTREVTDLTQFKLEDLGNWSSSNNPELHCMALKDRENNKTQLYQFKWSQGEFKCESKVELEGFHRISFYHKNIWLDCSSLDRPNEKIVLSPELKEIRRIPQYKGLLKDLCHNTYEYLKYDSFDGKKIPAYLSLPKGEIKGAVITSFYGGGNYYDSFSQLLAENNIALLSPLVRGSWGVNKQWRELILGDLGGNEILDLKWAALFLEKKLELKPNQIGLEGCSHGGYATLRALTMPKIFNSQEAQYPWGFGICDAGFADLENFYETSNIPDWLTNMLGPFERKKYRERSPVHLIENLKSPLLILHGKNDARVPYSTMKGFIDKSREDGYPAEIYLIDSQGHSSSGREEKKLSWQRSLRFIQKRLASQI